MELFEGEKVFDYPKPTSLIMRLIKYGFLHKNDIVLDFFSGSGTTADALIQYNAKYANNSRFILVQMPENLDQTIESADINARKSIRCAMSFLDKIHKPHFITEIGKERIRRAGKKIKEENKGKEGIENLDTGFRVLKLDSSNMEDVYYTPQEFDADLLFNENVKSDRTSEDLLFQVMLHSEFGRQEETFTLADVEEGISRKMIHRHPHVFPDAEGRRQKKDWDALKKEEKAPETPQEEMEHIPHCFPALLRTQKIQKKSGKKGFLGKLFG